MKCLILDGSIGPIKERVALAMIRTDVDAVLITTSPSEFKDGEIAYINSMPEYTPTVSQMFNDLANQSAFFIPAPKNYNAFPRAGKAADATVGYKDGEEDYVKPTWGNLNRRWDHELTPNSIKEAFDLPAEDKINGAERRGNDGC